MMTLPVRPPVIVHHMAAVPLQATLDGRWPPNSLEAIRACLEAKAAFIEIDISALADSDYLLVHDDMLESETSGMGLVARCSAQRARELCIRLKDGTPTALHVPLLSEVVALFQQYPGAMRLQLDFKNLYPFPKDEPLRRLVDLIRPLGDRVMVSTGADWQLRAIRRLADWLDLGLDIGNNLDWREPTAQFDSRYPPWKVGAYGYWDDHPIASYRFWTTAEYLAERCEMLVLSVPRLSTFYIDHHFLVRSLDDGFNWADGLHSFGIKLDTWTLDADNPLAVANAKRLLEAGVDMFSTNTPAALAAILNGK
jgi:glycerophosphoryl diester phosphodiesterase